MGKIIDCQEQDEFFVFVENEDGLYCDEYESKNIGWISLNGTLHLRIDGSLIEYKCDINDLDGYTGGDIAYIGNNSHFGRVYDSVSREIDIFMTNQCNSNCVMCPLPEIVRKKKNEKQIEWIKKYIDILPEDVNYVNVTGGEPTFAKDDLLDIMERLKKKFLYSDFQLLTNGRSLADHGFLNRVIDASPSGIRFAVPIHASNPSIHDAITRSEGSFKQTDKGIRNLLKERQKVEIRVVISRKNLDVLNDTAEYISRNYPGLFCVNYIGMEMMGNAALNRESLWVDYSEAFNSAKYGIDYLVRNGIDVQLYNFPLCDINRGYWHIAAKSITDYKVRYMDECEQCAVKEICGGFFQSTKQIMKPKVHPIKE